MSLPLIDDLRNLEVMRYPGVGMRVKAQIILDPKLVWEIWESFLKDEEIKVMVDIKIPMEKLVS